MKFLAYVGLWSLAFIWMGLMILVADHTWFGEGGAIGLTLGYGSTIHSWLERKIKSEL